jgi:DNA-binding IclR family transcriptional regulator
MPRTGRPAARPVAAVARALTVLDAVATGPGDVGTNEIARRTGINPSTVSRLLATLAGAGYVDHIADSGRYRLGLRLLELGNLVVARLDLREVARLHLATLVSETGETATLSAPAERDAVTVDFVQSRSSVQSVARLGRPSVSHATATGKVLLAFGKPALPPGPLPAFTKQTITNRRTLAAEVERVRRRGWAEAAEEREHDLSAIAAPVFGHTAELIAILGVQGPSSRFDGPSRRRAVAPLLDHARAVSEALGWTPSMKTHHPAP